MTEEKKAVFLDRDGVLIQDCHLLTKSKDILLLDGVHSALKKLVELDYLLFLISNQSVVARGLMTEKECHELNSEILNLCTNGDFEFTGISLCFHHPDAQVEEWRADSDNRKPKAGAILKFIQAYNIDVKSSYMVGDRESDIIAGNISGLKSVLVSSTLKTTGSINYFEAYKEELKLPDVRYKSLLEFSNSLSS